MPHVHPFLVAQLLALLILVNGTPVIATKFSEQFSRILSTAGPLWQMGSLYLATPKPFAASCFRLW